MTVDLARAKWRKSSRSGGNGGQCVEVAQGQQWAAIRDSKDPDGAALVLAPAQWATFAEAVKKGRFGA